MARKLRRAHEMLQLLRANGLVTTSNPRALGEAEIGALLDHMNARDSLRLRPLTPGSQALIFKYLAVFLQHLGNPVVQQMRAKRLLRFPRYTTGPLPCPTEAEVAGIIARLQEAVAAGDLDALGVLGMAVLCAYAGVRLKEARLATKTDLSTTRWELTVLHPKGEGTWGAPRRVKVVPPGRQAVLDFLDLRARELGRRGLRDGREMPLVPYIRRGREAVPWPDPYLHKVKAELDAGLGLGRWDFRGLRRAFGQNALDRGARIEAVSVALGHATTRTTEQYYARLRFRDASEELERVYTPRVSIPPD
jgi:integrase/recombinase XerD